MPLTDAFLSKTIKIILSAIAISIVLFSLNASSAFNVYAQQQGGAATGGAATGGAATSTKTANPKTLDKIKYVYNENIAIVVV
jgi:hypothetical protein